MILNKILTSGLCFWQCTKGLSVSFHGRSERINQQRSLLQTYKTKHLKIVLHHKNQLKVCTVDGPQTKLKLIHDTENVRMDWILLQSHSIMTSPLPK